MKSPELKQFIRIWTALFLALFAGSYFLGLMPASAEEAFLAFVRPNAVNSSNSPVTLTTVPFQAGNKTAPPETWASARIIIPRIQVDFPVVFPTSHDLDTLNADLLKGAVHYPDSAMPGRTGNALLFGHSTMLPARNPAYKVFSRLKELNQGDLVAIRSDNREYAYFVTKVEIKQAGDAEINLASDKKILTLSTCNIIGGKESRYVVEAEFVKSYPLAK